MELDLLIRGVLAPVLMALALMCACGWRSSRARGASLALALLVSCAAQEPIVSLPPTAAWQWVPLAVLMATLLAMAAGERGIDRTGRGVVCALASLLACLMLPLPEWSTASSRIGLAAAMTVVSMLLMPLGLHRGGASFWLGLSLSLTGAAVMVLATGFAKLAVPVGAVGVACVLVAARAPGAPHGSMHAGIAGTIAIVTILGLASAAAFAFETISLPAWIPWVSALAPLGLWLGEAPPFRASRAASALGRLVGAGLPACVAATAAVLHASSADRHGDAYAGDTDATRILHTELVHASR